ncbi:MAG: DUF1844 domain-containing protein [Candidatus Omnitrophica bacterium]|nr:DUF1844 domain-containing protein [Candidatus Omnitrophota bacterium]
MTEEDKRISEKELSEIRFIQYVSILANASMQQMGKIMNPVTGKTEKNLEASKATIELLSMLKEKTKGNLTTNEEQVLSNALANLQLNYADEVNRMEKESGKS